MDAGRFRLLLCLGYCEQCCSKPWGRLFPFRSCFSMDIHPGVGLQGHMVALFLVFNTVPYSHLTLFFRSGTATLLMRLIL